MARKPRYEELQKNGKELDRKPVERKQVEKALLESEEEYRNLLNTVNDLIFSVDVEGNILFANTLAKRFTGYEPEETTGHNFTEYVHPDDVPQLLENIQQALSGEPQEEIKGVDQDAEYRMLRRDGEVIWVATRVNFIMDKQGKIIGFSGVCRDITERRQAQKDLQGAHEELERRIEERTAELVGANKQLRTEIEERKEAEKALHESEQKYKILTENSLTGVHIQQDGKYVFVNDRFAEIHGYRRGEMIGKHCLTLVHPDQRELVEQRLSQRLKGEAVPQCYEVKKLRKDGETIWCEIMLTRIQYRGKLAIMGNTIDISERKQAEQALRESEERFKEMADLLPTIISELDMDFNLTYVNQVAFETFDYSQEDFEEGLNVIDMIHADDRERAIRNIKKVIKGGKLDESEYRMLRKDGSELTVLIYSRPIYENGKVVGIRSTLTDITKRERAEQALRERETELEIKTNSLEEVNSTLRVLLKRRDEDRTELEEKVLFNVKELVVPFLKRLNKSQLDPKQLSYIDILESNLNDIISPFSRNLSTKYLSLTPTEIQVANLIKKGKTTKEIGEVMMLSPRTIETHRKNMRRKFGLEKKKENLRSHLLVFQ